MTELVKRYSGRRFFAYLFTSTCVMIAFFYGPPENFGTFTQVMGALFVAFAGGQSATDWKKYSVQGAPR